MRTAGRLRDFVYVRKFTSTKNAAMEVVESFSTGTGRECGIRYLMGTEREQAKREGNEKPVEVRFRYEPGLVDEKDRLENRETSPWETYDVESVIFDRIKTEIICTCKLRT